MAFDPKAFLAEEEEAPATGGFDPKAFLAEGNPDVAKHKAIQTRLRGEKDKLQTELHDESGPLAYAKAGAGKLWENLKTIGHGAQAIGEASITRVPLGSDPKTSTWEQLVPGLAMGALPEEQHRQIMRGVSDMTTLGYGTKFADWITSKLPESVRRGPSFKETESQDTLAAPDIRTGAQLAAAPLGASGYIGRNAAGVAKGMTSVLPNAKSAIGRAVGKALQPAATAATTYTLAAPVMAAASANAEGERGKAALDAFSDIGGLGLATGLGAAAGVVKRAPARAAETDLKAMSEGYPSKVNRNVYVPKKEQINSALNEPVNRPIRQAIARNPADGRDMAHDKIAALSEEKLNKPIYDRFAAAGQDGVPVQTTINNLRAAQSQFTTMAEKPQKVWIQGIIDEVEAEAAKRPDATLPMRMLQEEATAYQKQAFASNPNGAEMRLTPEMKAAVGGALRKSIADHVENIADDPTRQAFEAANQEVSLWYKIHQIADLKSRATEGGQPWAADAVKKMMTKKGALETVARLPLVAGKAIDRNVVAPLAEKPAVQAAGRAAGAVAGPGAINPILAAQMTTREKKRRAADALTNLNSLDESFWNYK